MYADEYEEIQEITAGNIAAVTGLKVSQTGDTLISWNDKSNTQLYPLALCPPVISRSLTAESLAEEKKLKNALNILQREDPSLRVSTDDETEELVISGMGELHLEICTEKLRNMYQIKFSMGPISVSLRQTIVCEFNNQNAIFEKNILGRHVKIGLELDISPVGTFPNQVILADSTENKTECSLGVENIYLGEKSLSQLKLRNLPLQYPRIEELVIAIKKGLVNSLEKRGSGRYPFINTHIVVNKLMLLDGSPFSPSLLTMASYSCLNSILSTCKSVSLEPTMKLDIRTHDKYLKVLSKDLITFRQGHILSVSSDMESPLKTITALIPMSKMEGYSAQFRSLTEGKGSYSFSCEGFAPKFNSHI